MGRPVKWTCERSEAFVSDYQGRDLAVDAELALDAEGHFLALRGPNIGNAGAHTAGELFKQLAKINIVHVPYKGPGAGVVAVLSGEVSFHFASGPTVLPHAKDGKVRLLASSGAKRSRFTPNLPAINETLPGHEATQWFAIMAPAGMGKDIIARLHPALVAIMGAPKVIEQFAAVGSEPVGSTPEELTAFIRAEVAKWSKVIKSGVSLD